ncbi:flavodoxin [Clostridium sp. D2Q-11]|uniref:Flavodoxin n=1 Tax=Anaeromonas frigoriresistens TaxID=2683708 RepID=A0A942Z7F4_9FIRM|nr:flavodoxin domain-containing protein [Anaeromonas frigoriresistens]MBS4539511.1 flavodoxin [Anaeromonas frigoriresistens]
MKSIIIYSTKYGCTEKVAGMIKDKIDGEVHLFNISKEKPNNIDYYDNIILGGSIYVGKIRKDIRKYAEENIDLLLTKNLGLFICAGHVDQGALKQELDTAFPEELNNHATVKEILGSEVNFSKMKFLDKAIMKKVSGYTEDTSNIDKKDIEKFVNKFKKLSI